MIFIIKCIEDTNPDEEYKRRNVIILKIQAPYVNYVN